MLSIGLFTTLMGLAIWDYRRGAAKIYRLIVDGLILAAVAALSGAVLGIAAAILGYKFRFPWWVGILAGLTCFALLEKRKVSAIAKAR